MVDWRKIRKIDAHIHIVPDEVHRANPDAEDVWVYADAEKYTKQMEMFNVQRAVIMPLNDPWLMSMEFSVTAVHKNLCEIKQQFPGVFYAFADIDSRNGSEESVTVIRRAVEQYGLDGIKIHPNNSGVCLDSGYYDAILTFAQERQIPVAIHSFPNTMDDPGAADRIVRIMEKYPKLKVIVSHMGAYQWEKLLNTSAYADISAILPHYVNTYGIRETNRILRKFGTKRLLFATDYPDSRILVPDQIYDSYFDILNRMDFSEKEAEMIAAKNIESILSK